MPPPRWHPSHQSLEWHKAIQELYRPARPKRCQMCQWPGSIENVCTVCLDMIKTLLNRPTHYWLDLEARERILKRLRQQEEGGILGFTS